MFFKKKNEDVAVDVENKNMVPEEEVTETPTTKIGYFLLFIMAVLVFSFGQWIIADVSDIPTRPVAPTNCFSFTTNSDITYPERYYDSYSSIGMNYGNDYYGNYYDRYYYNQYRNDSGQYSDIDRLYGIDDACEKIIAVGKTGYAIQAELNTVTESIYSANSQLENLRRQYDLSLQEIQAGYGGNYDQNYLSMQIRDAENQLKILNTERTTLENSIAKNQAEIRKLSDAHKDEYKDAVSKYTRQYYWYLILVFLSRLIVIGPMFAFALHYYLKLKKRNSANAIIAGSVLIPFAILFIQITIGWIWGMFPRSWIEAIIRLFEQLAFFRYVIYYGSIVLVIALIGGIVYFIQKRIFSAERVAIRRLKDYKCPQCEFPIKGHDFCPKCGNKVMESCASCGGKRYVKLPNCPSCGSKKQ